MQTNSAWKRRLPGAGRGAGSGEPGELCWEPMGAERGPGNRGDSAGSRWEGGGALGTGGTLLGADGSGVGSGEQGGLCWEPTGPEPRPHGAAPLPAPAAPPLLSSTEPLPRRLDLRCSSNIFERDVLIRRWGPDGTWLSRPRWTFPPRGETGLRGRPCVPSSRRCNLPSSPRNTIAPPADQCGRSWLLLYYPFSISGEGLRVFTQFCHQHPPGCYPQHPYLFWGVPVDPAESTDGRGKRRGARAGAHPAPAPLPAAGTASDAPRHKGTLSAHSVQLTDKTTTTTKGTYG